MVNMFKIAVILILMFFVFGFVYKILFKLGMLALLVLAVLYLFNRVFARK